MLVMGPDVWVQAAREPWPWERQGGARPIQELHVSSVQAAYIAQLPDADARAQYLSVLESQHARQLVSAHAALNEMTATPESWLLASLRGAINSGDAFVWSFVASGALCLIAPPVLIVLVGFAVASRTLVHYHISLEAEDATYRPPQEFRASTLWEAIVRRLDSSADALERQSLFLGFSKEQDRPIYLDRRVLNEHGHILGDSGSRKTSLGIAPLVNQLVRTANTEPDTCSVVVIDLKGDPSLFHEAKQSARGAGVPFKLFTDQVGSRTHIFNPFSQAYLARLTRTQRAEIIIQSLGLDYGEGYGPSYFSAVSRDLLVRIFERYSDISSFQRLLAYLSGQDSEFLRGVSRRQKEDAAHVAVVTRYLAAIHPLNACSDPSVESHIDDKAALEQQIDALDVVTRPQVVYFYLPSLVVGGASRECAKLALYSLLTAADRAGQRQHRTYVFVDEFQRAVSQNLATVMEQARSKRVSLILANHTLAQLKQFGLDAVLQATTRFRQYFSASDLHQQDHLIKASGDGLYTGYRWSTTEFQDASDAQLAQGGTGAHQSPTIQVDEGLIDDYGRVTGAVGPRHTRNTVIDMADDETLSIVHVTRGAGLSQFKGHTLLCRSLYHIPFGVYRERDCTPPALDDAECVGTVLVTPDGHDRTPSVSEEEEVERKEPVAAGDGSIMACLKSLAQKKRAETPWLDNIED